MFLVFMGWDYYPEGGWKDYAGTFPTLLEANVYVALHSADWDWYQIVDLEKGEIVRSQDME